MSNSSPTFIGLPLASTACVASVLVALLAGCAAAPEPKDAPAPPVAVAPAPPLPAPPAPPPPPAIDVSSNPVVVVFSATSASAPAEFAAFLPELVARARAATRVTITGYADQIHGTNARNIAMARATVLRDQMVKAGVPASRVQVKSVSGMPDKQVAEITFTEKKSSKK